MRDDIESMNRDRGQCQDCLQHMKDDIESMNRDRGKCQTAYNT